jgi:hypothetical protein
LKYVHGTYDQGLTYFDPGDESKNPAFEITIIQPIKLIGWMDSDFESDPDTRKSMTGYLMSLNGGAISWRSSRQGGVTLSSRETEFVVASQAGEEEVYLCVLLRGFDYTQKKPTEIWEDNASCRMMSENLTNRDHQDMSMSRYTVSVTWLETAM